MLETAEKSETRKATNRRYYLAKKLKDDPAALTTLLAKRREIDTQLAELRELGKTHIVSPTDEGKQLQAIASEIIAEIDDTLSDHDSKYQIMLMVSEDLRSIALKSE